MGSRAHRVIAYDRRGFARSSPGAGGGLAEHARDAAELLNALGASPATVVGWSGGGVMALDLAASFPDRVAALVLAEPAVHLTTHPTRAALAMEARFGFHRYVRRDPAAALTLYRWASGYKTGGNTFDALPEEWREQTLANAPATLREMDQMIRPYPTRAAIRSIECPVTVIEGDLSDPHHRRHRRRP
jgi:pimeloyl-ACP methyl ester carboxylesterase